MYLLDAWQASDEFTPVVSDEGTDETSDPTEHGADSCDVNSEDDEEVEVKDVPVDVQRASDEDSWLRDEKTVRTATPATDATSDSSDVDVERAL